MRKNFRLMLMACLMCATLVAFTSMAIAQNTDSGSSQSGQYGSDRSADRSNKNKKSSDSTATSSDQMQGEHKGHDMGKQKSHDMSSMGKSSNMAGNAQLNATLVNPDKMSQEKAATIEVNARGVKIVDPAKAGQQPRKGQAHFHYKLDDGPVIATTSTKLSFHQLSSGAHKLTVQLAGNDHQPLGPEQTLDINIP